MGLMDKHRDKGRARLATGLVAYALGLSSVDILETRRGSTEVAQARQISMYIVYVGFGISLARVAAAFDRDRSTVAYACHQVEDRRDDLQFDTWLDELERALKGAAGLAVAAGVAA